MRVVESVEILIPVATVQAESSTCDLDSVKIDSLVRSNRQTISIEVKSDAKLVVRAPLKAPISKIMAFVSGKEEWILAKQAELRLRMLSAPPKNFSNGEMFLYLGESFPLLLVDGAEEYLRFDKAFYLSAGFPYDRRQLFVQWYRGRALEVLLKRVEQYAELSRIRHSGVSLSDAVCKWGSCSHDGKLMFSWRLVMAPLPVVDYVVAHELAHVVEHNHSIRFWRKLSELMPGYASLRLWLRENGHQLSF